MKLSELIQLINARTDVKMDQTIKGLENNADAVQSGFVFFAIKGVKQNGADFIPTAVQNGAVAVVADQRVDANIPVLYVDNAREALTTAARQFYPDDLQKVAVTGTNGKSSTVFFVNQFLNAVGTLAASVGTVGIQSPVLNMEAKSTTPDPLSMHRIFHQLSDKNVRVVAMEASSHGLHQNRLEGVLFQAAGFTNLTRDHLDYHKTMEAYLDAKMLLFTRHVVPGGTAVINADIPEFNQIKIVCEQHGLKVLSYGHRDADLEIVEQEPTENGQRLRLKLLDRYTVVDFPVVGDFQAMNLLCALGLCLGVGADLEQLIREIPMLKAPNGRMDLVAELPNKARIYVDYAHTPDALERVLISLRAHVRGRLICLFGCGGNRDTGKRAQMGAIAQKLADIVYITDDNPRFEKAGDIRHEIKSACPKGIEIDNRERAIFKAVHQLEPNDILVLCGKGHEPGQMIQGVNFEFDDKIEARLALMSLNQPPLWSANELQMALSVPVAGTTRVYGVSIDSRTTQIGDIYIALKGEKTDGHQYVHEALRKGASACIVDHLLPDVFPHKQIVVPDTMKALESLARFARMRSEAVFIGITGSSGKTTTKEMLRTCLSDQGLTYATAGNYNNQIGVPLTLARMPMEIQYAIIEMGMNHHGELTELSDLVRPDVTIITMVGMAHAEYFKDEADTALAKSEIFNYQNRFGTAVLNYDSPFYAFFLDKTVEAGIKKTLSFGHDEKADFCIESTVVENGKTHVCVKTDETKLCYDLHFLGEHFVMNSAGVLAVVDAVGASTLEAAKSLSKVMPVSGRGLGEHIILPNGTPVLLIDDAYNANPSSMKASIQSLGLRPDTGRKIVVLGDMLELGDKAAQMHLDLAQTLIENRIQKVYATGPFMKLLYDALPVEMRGAWTETVGELTSVLFDELQSDDIVLVKSSHGSGLYKLVQELKGNK